MKKYLLAFLFASASFALAEPVDAAAPAVSAQPLSLWQVLQSGGVVMVPLGVLSIIAVALILIYLFTLTRGRMVSARYVQTAEALIRKKDWLGLIAISSRHNEATADVVLRMTDFVTKNPDASLDEAREIAEAEGTRLASRFNQQVVYLADIGTIAPMLGLLGTVLGMVQSFNAVAADAASTTRPLLLAAGVSEALIATAAGLCIGIPAMAAYAYFRGRLQALLADFEAATTHLLALFAANYVPGEISRPTESLESTRASGLPPKPQRRTALI
ncbi:MAG TPA: MotA/TolQ/ExbB proton channel family protein [Chthoniobacterales bacterium]